VLDRREILDYSEAYWTGKWYEPPVSMAGLSKSFRANPHHSSAIYVKRNVLVNHFIPHALLTRSEFSRYALDFIMFGNSYLEEVRSRTGKRIQFKASMAKYSRVGKDEKFFFVPGYGQEHEFKNKVFHLLEPDPNQEIY